MIALAILVLQIPSPRTLLNEIQMGLPAHHTKHRESFGQGVPPFNLAVLAGADRVQASAPEGGGYFIGVKAIPAESPVGYAVRIGSRPLLDPPRKTSYCSGSSYSAFAEALTEILGPRAERLSSDRFEALRMQEPDGSRREDRVKAWGWWNADGDGCQYCLVQYLGLGEHVTPNDALPGDFMNISWKSGLGHSVVFLGWGIDAQGRKGVRYWSSQTGTNGFGDQFSVLTKISSVYAVRLTQPERIFRFDPHGLVNPKISDDVVSW